MDMAHMNIKTEINLLVNGKMMRKYWENTCFVQDKFLRASSKMDKLHMVQCCTQMDNCIKVSSKMDKDMDLGDTQIRWER